MIDFFQAVADYRFMQYALIACLLASIGCGMIGTFVVVKQLGSLAGGIAHAVLAGMGIAFFLGLSPMLGAILMALFSALLIGYVNLRLQEGEDVLIAAFWSVGMAVGILFISKTPGYNVNLLSYLFGNILLVSTLDLARMFILDIIIGIILLIWYRQFLAAAFDEEYARVRGVHVELFYIVLLMMVALTVVLLIQIVGLILVIALLILPAASAARFAGSLPRIMAFAVLLSLFVTVGGLALSYRPDLPSGAVIVIVAGLVYVVAMIAGRRLTIRR